MQALLRSSCRRLGSLLHARAASTEVPLPAKKYPSQIGGACYQEGDRVIITIKEGKRHFKRLTAPLRADGITSTGGYSHKIKHNSIIGQPAVGRLHVPTESTSTKSASTHVRVTQPSLEQFVSLAPREVTPIYSSYGATIVDLLDIHPSPPSTSNHPERANVLRLEILEAGTGNGGLTLHLARAIAAANPPPPQIESEPDDQELEETWGNWRKNRRALVHTVEFQASRSRAAEKLIKSFRGALYWPHVDFHSGDVGTWARDEQERRRLSQQNPDGFLDIVVLDVPGVDQQIRHVVDAMKDAAQLVVWVPQVTQVAACQFEIDRLQLPLNLDQVVELGEGISNGRQWDLRFVKPRAEQKKELEARDSVNMSDSSASEDSAAPSTENNESLHATDEIKPGSVTRFPTMVCRPKVGELIMGGGFVGIWRRKSRSRSDSTST